MLLNFTHQVLYIPETLRLQHHLASEGQRSPLTPSPELLVWNLIKVCIVSNPDYPANYHGSAHTHALQPQFLHEAALELLDALRIFFNLSIKDLLGK